MILLIRIIAVWWLFTNRVEHSYSICSSVSDEDAKSFGESRNLESLGRFLFARCSKYCQCQRQNLFHTNLRLIMINGEALREYEIIDRLNSGEDEMIISKLNHAIDVGLKVVDREKKHLLRRQSTRLSRASECSKSLLTIDEVDESRSQSDAERRMSRGLSIPEQDCSTLLRFKRSLTFDGNDAQYFSWSSNLSRCEDETYEDEPRKSPSRGMSLLDEARKSLKGGVAEEYEVYDTSHYLMKLSAINDEETDVRRGTSLDSYKMLLSFCLENCYDDERTIFEESNAESE
jgi:hypothetical protein